MPGRPSRFAAIRGAFSNRNYAIYTTGNAISLIGFWVQRLAVGWLAWQLTKSSFWLGAVAFADLFPVVIIGPFAGVLADHMDRRRVLLICLVISTLQALSLFALVATDLITIEILFVLTLIFGITVGFQQPARLSLIPALVRPENLTSAVALNSVIFNTARFIGPAIAGLIISSLGVAPGFLFNALTYLVMIAAVLQLRLPQGTGLRPRTGSLLAEIQEGITYVARHPAIGPIMLLMIATVLTTRPILEFLPGFADAVFARGAEGLAALTSVVGLGAIVGGVWLAQRDTMAGLTTVAIVSSAVSGLTLAIFAMAGWFYLAIVILVIFGTSVSTAGISVQTLIQSSVDDHVRGRVLSFWGLTFRGGPAIGALVIGGAAEVFGLRLPFAVAGILCFVAAVLMFKRRKRIAEAFAGTRPPTG